MTITRHLIDRTAFYRNLIIPDSLREWLLIHYEVEPYEDFFLEEDLEALIEMHCQAYHKGMLHPALPDPVELWKDRYYDLREILADFRSEREELIAAYDHAIDLLEANGIKIDS